MAEVAVFVALAAGTTAGAAVFNVSLAAFTNLIIPGIDRRERVKGQIDELQGTLPWLHFHGEQAYKNRKSDEYSKLIANDMLDLALEAEDIIEEYRINEPRRNSRNLLLWDDLRDRITDFKVKEKSIREKQSTGGGTASSSSDSSMQQKIKVRRAEIFKEICQQEPDKIYESNEKQVIDDLLTGKDKELRIISIIGMGGVGKTTFSLKVLKNEKVVRKFNCRAYVYISENYTPQEVFKSIMKSCDSYYNGEVTSEQVRAHLQNKKYLMVLDDIWDTDDWTNLKDAFPEAKNGSRVLLTTRHKRVALEAKFYRNSNNMVHELSAINDEDKSWELFLKNYIPYSSLLKSKEDVSKYKLVELGKKMIKKCHGLPLAIVVLGSLLSSQEITQASKPIYYVWSNENASSSWISSQGDDSYKCPGILALSYDYLRYHLQPCFLYMSLFPSTSTIRVTKLVQFWIAEGLIKDRQERMMEDIAEDYLNELIDRSLVQVGKRRSDGSVSTCHIHGLLHGISDSESTEDKFSQTFGSVVDFNRNQDSRTRRVAVYCKEQTEQCFSKSHNDRIRSLMCDVRCPEKTSIRSLFGGFKSLRVLEFNGYTGIVSLPKVLGELIHLRYLSLGKTKLEKINTSYLSKLVNLQTLNLKGHEAVLDNRLKKKEVMLDDQIWCLKQLRNLYLKNIRLPAAKHKGHWRTSTVPKFGIDKLKELRLLFIQAGDWINEGGLAKLNSSLRKLKIEECLFSHSDEISRALAKLTELRSLALIYKTSIDEPVINEEIPLASIHLSNHTSLVSLHLKGRILDWSRGRISFPPQLCKLKLKWSWIMEDPMLILENLPSLRFLHLGFESYRGERMVCSKGGFVSLETLELDLISSLKKWKIKKTALASLTKLTIRNCQNLEKIPRGLRHLTTVKELTVENMPQLRSRMAENGQDWHKIRHIPSKDIRRC